VITILDIVASHVVSFAKVGKSCGISTLELSNMTLVFLPPNVISVVQPLDHGIMASSNFNTRRNFSSGFCHNMMMLH
jgi:hypothetical protein